MGRNMGWRTVSVLIEVPVRGARTDKMVVEAVRDSFDHSLPKLDVPALGRVRVKNAKLVARGKVQAATQQAQSDEP